MKKVKNALLAAALVGVPAIAMATPPTEFEVPELPMGLIYALGTVILAGLATLWVFRKGVKTTNRS